MASYKHYKEENFNKVLFDYPEAGSLFKSGAVADAAKLLFEKQKHEWPLLKKGTQSLADTKFREINFNGFKIKLQYNPNRITSTQAKTDNKSIKERECFLCYSNLPPEQKGILYEHEYLIVCNPFPIFEEHFTLPNINHFPQAIKGHFRKLLNFSKDLSKHYSVFYNGPKCGASAPDHLHFQAGSKNFLPVEQGFETIKELYGEDILSNINIEVTGVNDGLRRFISIESINDKLIINVFELLYGLLQNLINRNEEPPLNIIAGYEEERGWRIIIFLRSKHRPSRFFAGEDSNILFSPGVVDMGGVCILPREKDFKNLNKEILNEIFNEVVLGKEYFDYIKSGLRKRLDS